MAVSPGEIRGYDSAHFSLYNGSDRFRRFWTRIRDKEEKENHSTLKGAGATEDTEISER
jgi:hypothetical protein